MEFSTGVFRVDLLLSAVRSSELEQFWLWNLLLEGTMLLHDCRVIPSQIAVLLVELCWSLAVGSKAVLILDLTKALCTPRYARP